MYLCRARVSIRQGRPSDELTHAIVADVLLCLEQAKLSKELFPVVVYNAAVVWWRACRPLMQDGKWHGLLPSIVEVVDALARCKHPDVLWRVRLMLTMAKAKHAVAEPKVAVDVVKQIYTMLKDSLPDVRAAAARMQLAMGISIDLLAKQKLDNPVLDVMIKVWLAENAPKKGGNAATILLECHAALLAVRGVLNDEDMKRGDWRNDVDGPQRVEALVGLVTLGRTLLLHFADGRLTADVDDAVVTSIAVASRSTDAGTSPIDAEVLQTEYNLHIIKYPRTGTAAALEYSKGQVKRRLEMLDNTLGTLQSARNAGDLALVQRICCVMWNCSRSLLQPNLRHHVRRPLEKVLEALESINSSMSSLMSIVHIELAKIAYDAGLLTTVERHLAVAQQLDEANEHRVSLEDLQRLMATKVQVEQLEVADVELSVSDRALALVELARSASGADRCRGPLLQAGKLLAVDIFHPDLFPLIRTGNEGGSVQRYNIIEHHMQESISTAAHSFSDKDLDVWCGIAHVARRSRDWDVAYCATKFALWTAEGLKGAGTEEAKAFANNTKRSREEAELHFIRGGGRGAASEGGRLRACSRWLCRR